MYNTCTADVHLTYAQHPLGWKKVPPLHLSELPPSMNTVTLPPHFPTLCRRRLAVRTRFPTGRPREGVGSGTAGALRALTQRLRMRGWRMPWRMRRRAGGRTGRGEGACRRQKGRDGLLWSRTMMRAVPGLRRGWMRRGRRRRRGRVGRRLRLMGRLSRWMRLRACSAEVEEEEERAWPIPVHAGGRTCVAVAGPLSKHRPPIYRPD